jgi:phage terminase large subunit
VTEIVIDYAPRAVQRQIHRSLAAHRFGVAVAHRRMGKTVLAVNHLIRAALTCSKERPRFAYIAPTFTQGKQIAWDYLKHYTAPIPGAVANESELRIDLPNGGQVRIYGADNPDRLRGIYLDGAVLDEYGLMQSRTFTEVVAPTLVDRQGWAFFIGTPNGKNHFWDIVRQAETQPDWFVATYRASETGLIAPEELARARAVMSEDEYQQEFECSFEASVKGAVWASEMAAVRETGRIAAVPYDPRLPVDTYWDLGIGDATAIWYVQTTPSGEIRVIDYDEDASKALPHYIGRVKSKPYVYGEHWAPHDIEVREYSSGQSRWQTAMDHGLHFRVGKRLPLEDGLNAVRMVLPRCWFDVDRTAQGREALMNYRYKRNTRLDEFDLARPEHDWSSHGADAFRLLALQHWVPSQQQAIQFQRQRAEVEALRAVNAATPTGPTGETLPQALARLAALRAGTKDRDKVNRRVGSGRRGGW